MKKDNDIIIRSTNTKLVLPEGVSLALVDANGKILEQGDKVKADVFDAMKRFVIDELLSGERPLNATDT